MRPRLIALSALAVAALAGCGGGDHPAASSSDQAFRDAVHSTHLDIDPASSKATRDARSVCRQLMAGDDVRSITSDLVAGWTFSDDQARDFMASAVTAYCPTALD